VDGFLRVGQTPGVEGETFNLGTGVEVRIGDLAQQIIDLVGRPVSIHLDPERLRPEKSEVQRLLSDNRRAFERLGWRPRVELHQGLGETIAWIRLHLTRYRPGVYSI
jgi:dTDP-glucose 4,6-dehydratase